MPQVPKLQLPDCREVLAFRAVCTILRADPTLRRIGIKFVVWDGSTDDLVEPMAAMLPFIEIQPSPNSTGWASESEHRSDVSVDFSLATRGTNADDLLNLWAAVRSALFVDPGDPRRAEIAAVMDSVGAQNGTLTAQPFQVVSVDSGTKMLYGEGSLKLRINVNT